MLRTILVGLVSLSSLFIGVKVKSYYKKRADIWDELYKFALFYKEEITFCKTLLEDIFKNFDLTDELKDVKDGKFDNLPINLEECNFIKDFFASLGHRSAQLEVENIERYILKIKEKCELATKISRERGSVSIKLGVLVGVGVFVLLI